jgi:osmotically-inducible protein OsmY
MHGLEEVDLSGLRHNRDIAEMAKDRLQQTAYGPLRNVACTFDRGTIFLRGTVPRYYLKQVAQEAVGNLPCVRQVVNQIEVLWPKG